MSVDAEIDSDAELPSSDLADDAALALAGKRVLFVGKLGGVTRREAQQLVRQFGGTPVEEYDDQVQLVVIGADELPLTDEEESLPEQARTAAAEGRLEVLAETQLWQRLGLVDSELQVRRLYTPAMLADLLKVSVATIRRWHRRGLIVPAREVHRLPYFDFQEVATARRLAELVAAGASPAAIERKLAQLARIVPGVERPLAQLSVIVEGRQILLRQGEGLIEPGGQRRIDFEALEVAHQHAESGDAEPLSGVVPFSTESADVELSSEELAELATQAEDEGDLRRAMEMCRAALASAGPNPELCFRLAELLYRLGDPTAARERYYQAIELDEDFVEARANLGCLLVELGEPELAAAAFEGALHSHPDFPDAHYHLARTLDELGRSDAAQEHWKAFLHLAPDSPWAEEAWARLQQ